MRSQVASALMVLLAAAAFPAKAGPPVRDASIVELANATHPQVIAWRRDLHAHPELGNRETRTAALVAAHLKSLGLDVRTGVAHTGVVAVLKGGRPGGVVALRADMDALPVEEKTGLPFASTVTAAYLDGRTPVMHACGHDAHVAMLLGAATVLASVRDTLQGSVVFIFQPAEEGPPPGEEGGAALMVAQGALANPAPTAIFGLHVMPGDSGRLYYRPRGYYAAADRLTIRVKGVQTHGARPWAGVDIVSLGAEIALALNQVAARQLDVGQTPTVVTLATVHAGVRHNIIPEEMVMTGTLRTFDAARRRDVMARIERTARSIAERYGATVQVVFDEPAPVTFNDPALTAAMAPSLAAAAGGSDNVEADAPVSMLAEDFPDFTGTLPGLYFQLGARKPGVDPASAPANHSPYFDIDEEAMRVGVKAYALLARDYLARTGAVAATTRSPHGPVLP